MQRVMEHVQQERLHQETWQERAACKGPHAAVFFPPSQPERRDDREEREERAKAICRGCPVMRSCLEYAIAIREPHGIWGGLNENERKELSLATASKTA